ncbi:MAG TPA: methionine--tRNA ligase [Gaiellaceae bacterium]|nr:methionine--tRNA ligase [Gaiellaceae bacterium]
MSSHSPQKILVAVAWPYASGPRHLGHVAGPGVPSDIFARYHRLRGNDVLKVSGTDEHGTPVMVSADREGVSPRELADRNNALIIDDFLKLGLSFDTFTRTSTPNHYRVTQDIFRTLYEKGYLIEQTTLGAFSPSTGRTLPDRYIEGTCPICGYTEARGDQCDNCGNQLDPVDLIEPHSIIDGSTPEFRETTHLFLDLPAFAERLEEWLTAQEGWRPNVKNFSLGLVRELKPRAMTRDIDWGVPVPVPGYPEDTKRIYVWFDAVIGYLSASIEWAHNRGTPEAWREWWQEPSAGHYYFMGKDNIVFHSVIWPAMLMGYGDNLHLPTNVVASEYLTMEGKKASTSRGVAIWVSDFLSRYDPDPLRYYLTAAGPETQDTDFTWEEFVRRNNDELLANWGNLVNRTLVNAHRNFGAVPEPGELTEEDRALLAAIEAGFEEVGAQIERVRFKAALAEAMRLSSLANQYIADQAPWALVNTDRERAATVLYIALRAVDSLKTLLAPFLPFTSQIVHELLGHEGYLAGPLEIRRFDDHNVLTGDYTSWVGSWAPSELPVGRALPEPTPLFRKLPPETVDEELARLGLTQ